MNPERSPVTATVMKPMKLCNQVFSKLNAIGINFKASVVYFAFSCYNVQISAWDSGIENGAFFIL